MDNGCDVPKALRVGPVAMGVEQDVTKINRTALRNGTHKAFSTDRGHFGGVHIPC